MAIICDTRAGARARYTLYKTHPVTLSTLSISM